VYSGGGQQAVLLAERFIKHGHEAVLVGKEFGDASSAIESVPVWRVGRTASTRLAEHLALVRLLFRERRRYDTILFFGVDGGFYQFWRWLPLLKVLRKPSVARFTIASSAGTTQKRLGAAVPCLLHDRLITISTALTQSVKNQLPSWWHPHVIQISNGVDVGRFHPLNGTSRSRRCLELGLDPSFQYCVFVGRLSHRKGLDLLMESWRRIAASCPDARLLLLGPRRDTYRDVEDTQFLDTIDDYVRKHHLGDSLVEIGFTDEVDRYLQVADAFLSTSRREGCPNALLEAMATGTPVVASRISNTTDDLITDRADGFITDPEPISFGNAVIALLRSSELRKRVGETARQTALDRHDIDRVAGHYLDILEKCH
jgi:glycosyltransferase involved in cell wall biosynthesis